jgi:hypothetical protein
MLAVEVVAEGGFVPLEAGDPDEAVALLETCPDISLLFTDINMPGKHGRAKTGPCGPRPLAANKNPRRIGPAPAAAVRPAFAKLLFREPYRAAPMIAELHSLLDPAVPRMKL